MNTPIVSVVLPTHNRSKLLPIAIDSILVQTLQDFEIIIVDDGSVDDTPTIIKYLEAKDSRIRSIRSEKSKGPGSAFNLGIKQCRGKYVAIMADDDISLPQRLEKQVTFLESHPDYAVVGASFITVDKHGTKLKKTVHPATYGQIRWWLIFGCYLSIVMIRRSIFINGDLYFRSLSSAVDYDLWVRIAKKYKVANLKDVLYIYLIHGENISIIDRNHQKDYSYQLTCAQVSELTGISLSTNQVLGLLNSSKISNRKDAHLLSKTIIKLEKATKRWAIDSSDRRMIRDKAAAKLRSIWHAQNNDFRLLPYVLYSLFLYPKVLTDRLIKYFSYAE